MFCLKDMKFCLKWVHMARYELILRLDGALWLRIIFKPLLTSKRAIIKTLPNKKYAKIFQIDARCLQVFQMGLGQIRAKRLVQSSRRRVVGKGPLVQGKAGARPRTRRVLDRTQRLVGSMATVEHVQNMNRPLTSVQNMQIGPN